MESGVIGRDEELARARAFLGGLGSGPRALVIEGEAGIGKTAVWLQALDEAAARGCRVLRCAGEEAEARLSFVGLNDLIGDAIDAFLPALPAPQREALEVALLRRASGQGREPEPKAVAIALRSLLVELARASPVVVAVDDVQWLDAATARALAFAARRLDARPVGVLATVRAPMRSADVLGLERALGSERFERVRLGPLSLGALGALLEGRLGHRYRRPALLRIEQATGGNPLFALEVARALGPAPALEPGRALPVPASLREAVAERVAALPPRGRESLLVVAALSHADRRTRRTGLLRGRPGGRRGRRAAAGRRRPRGVHAPAVRRRRLRRGPDRPPARGPRAARGAGRGSRGAGAPPRARDRRRSTTRSPRRSSSPPRTHRPAGRGTPPPSCSSRRGP